MTKRNLSRFMGVPQWASLQSLMSGSEESEFFQRVAADLAQRIEAMPVIGGQEDSDAAQTVYLHYFLGASDVWVLEKDVGGGVEQVFAFALLNADYQMAELGYVDLSELLLLGFELDFHFSPAACRGARACANGQACSEFQPARHRAIMQRVEKMAS